MALSVAAAGLLAAGGARADLPPGCGSLGEALAQHACFHVVHGPSQTVTASVGTAPGEGTPAVDAVHTEYRLILPAGGEQGAVVYTPLRGGSWSVFLSDTVPFEVVGPDGVALPLLLAQTGDTGCDALPRAEVYDLEEGQTYTFVLGPAPGQQVFLVVEHVDDFSQKNGVDADGDGWGSKVSFVVTPCMPPAGHAPNALDCDDADAAVSPGAVEVCDGVDTNCNGVPDDVGLVCRAGEGACLREGKWACDSPGATATCDAAPGSPAAEVCNNEDDDCDGQIDEGDLCADEDAPACIREGFVAACGCLVDLDCGAPESGRTCNLAERTCEEAAELVAPREGDCQCSAPGAGGRAGWPAVACAAAALLCLARRRRRRRYGGRWWALAAGLCAAGSGCAGTIELDGPCVLELDSELTEHACSHGTYGPFETVVAAGSLGEAPPVDSAHVTYTVDLPQGGAALWVSYTPSRDEEHVVFTGGAGFARVVGAGGEPLELRSVRPPTACSVFDEAHAVRLEKGASYGIAFETASPSSTRLFIEHAATFGADLSAQCP